ncbi:MAG: hypothetical protein ACKVHO_12380, partial [Verrucomicrobiia bacterium]
GKPLPDASQQSGVGLAQLPLNRFAGIRPVAVSAQSTLKKPLKNIGQITMKPIDLAAFKTLTVNADATDGTVRVEVLNEGGYRMRNFTRAHARILRGDSLRHPVSWKGLNTTDLPPGKYMLRLHLDNAEVFAITLK